MIWSCFPHNPAATLVCGFVDTVARIFPLESTRHSYPPATKEYAYLSPYQERVHPVFDDKHAMLLSLVIAFRTPPSVNQIARVAHLPPEKVKIMLAPTLGHLITDHSSDIRLSKDLLAGILRMHGVDPAAANERLACWCLKFLDMRNVRDIAYATSHWAYHVCLAEATPDLIDALRDLAFPLVTLSTQQLVDVTVWLKNRTNGHDRVHDRIIQFETLLQETKTVVQQVGEDHMREQSEAADRL